MKFIILETNHLLINAKVNGVEGAFFLDTGASKTTIDTASAEAMNLIFDGRTTTANGAGVSSARSSMSNVLQIGPVQITDLQIMVFDMTHINETFRHHGISPVNGIIGSDILILTNAVIDYKNSCIYFNQ